MYGSVVAVVIIAAALILYVKTAHAQKASPIQVTWLISHEPITLFDRAEVDFANEFNKDGDGTIQISVKGPKDYGSTTGHLPPDTVLNALSSNQAQLATVVVGGLEESIPELRVMNLPYLFKDYASAEKVFNGPIGTQLLNIIDKNTNAKALAFTYSGGFVVIDSDTTKISDASQLSGLRIGTIDGPTAIDALDAYGAKGESMDASKGAKVNGDMLDQYDAEEIPYTRIFPEIGQKPKYVLESYNGVFTTAILVSDAFYNSLSPQNKNALQKAANIAAEDERQDSIALAQQHRQQLIDSGTVITTLSTSSVDQLKTAAQAVYQAYEKQFGSTLVNAIESAQQ